MYEVTDGIPWFYTFTDVFAALIAVVDTKFPEVGDLLLRRIVLQLKRASVGFVTECGSLLQDLSPQGLRDIFKLDPNFLENEQCYEELKKNILGEESSEDEGGSKAGTDDEDDEESEEEEDEEETMEIKEETETNLVNLRRTIYMTIMSSVDFEEAGRKLLKIKLEPDGVVHHVVGMLQPRENRLETNKLHNAAKFFAHLLGTDALPWHVLAYILVTEDTSSSHFLMKILFQELSEHLGICLLNECLADPAMKEFFEFIFPKDNPKNTRLIMQQQTAVSESESDSGRLGSSESEDSSSESASEASSSGDSESRRDCRHRKRQRRD
ncbi:hypothetical protein NE237_007849 [Protea cynaroides]|uniref:Pre-mRNA-splicing factor CWC22 homolog n=1 Tax=Protea cynaroides TaxID=273540 RepID=A0A9Q0KQ91_9MAGN|nr:hypothetical protein NE237_007849 [Protea cynaroides]